MDEGRESKAPFFVRLYSATEIRDLLNRAGLEVVTLSGGGGKPLSADSRGMVVVASKPQ